MFERSPGECRSRPPPMHVGRTLQHLSGDSRYRVIRWRQARKIWDIARCRRVSEPLARSILKERDGLDTIVCIGRFFAPRSVPRPFIAWADYDKDDRRASARGYASRLRRYS